MKTCYPGFLGRSGPCPIDDIGQCEGFTPLPTADEGGRVFSEDQRKPMTTSRSNYEMGMHCTGFVASHRCMFPPFTTQPRARSSKSRPHRVIPLQLLTNDPNDPMVLLDGDKKRSGIEIPIPCDMGSAGAVLSGSVTRRN